MEGLIGDIMKSVGKTEKCSLLLLLIQMKACFQFHIKLVMKAICKLLKHEIVNLSLFIIELFINVV